MFWEFTFYWLTTIANSWRFKDPKQLFSQRHILWNIEKYFINLLTLFEIFEDLQIKRKNYQYFIYNPQSLDYKSTKNSLKNKSSRAYFWCCTVVPQIKFWSFEILLLVNLFNGEITSQHHITNLCNLVKQ